MNCKYVIPNTTGTSREIVVQRKKNLIDIAIRGDKDSISFDFLRNKIQVHTLLFISIKGTGRLPPHPEPMTISKESFTKILSSQRTVSSDYCDTKLKYFCILYNVG